MRASLIVKATVSSAAATVGTIARNTTANSSSPRRLTPRISAIVLDPFQQISAHGGRTRPAFTVASSRRQRRPQSGPGRRVRRRR